MRGIEGTGIHGVHTSASLPLSSDSPLLIEAIDTLEHIRQTLEVLWPHLGCRLLVT